MHGNEHTLIIERRIVAKNKALFAQIRRTRAKFYKDGYFYIDYLNVLGELVRLKFKPDYSYHLIFQQSERL